jgi:hypothetical protein
MKRLSTWLMTLAASIVLFGAVTSAQATKIEYTQTGNTLNFTVFNNTLPSAISIFDISFGVTTDGLNFTNQGAFSNLTDGTAAAGWASIAFPPTVFANPWVYSAFVDTGSPLASGDSLAGFSTTFTLAGIGSVNHLWFNVYDADFNTLDSGFTTLHDSGPASAVPEPGTVMLLSAGFGGLLLYRRKKA